MCFNVEITAAMMALNLGTGLVLTKRGHQPARTQVREPAGRAQSRRRSARDARCCCRLLLLRDWAAPARLPVCLLGCGRMIIIPAPAAAAAASCLGKHRGQAPPIAGCPAASLRRQRPASIAAPPTPPQRRSLYLDL